MRTNLGVAWALVDGALVPGDVMVDDGRVDSVGVAPRGRSGIAAPGLVDLQVNGYAGVDVAAASGEELAALRRALLRDGVTSFAATVITGDIEAMRAAATRLRDAPRNVTDGARLLGVHLEGPWLSPCRLGTHPSGFRRDIAARDVARLVDGQAVVAVTLAPELPGAIDTVRRLTEQGIAVFLGHSDADAACAEKAFAAGAVGTTHLFNAMAPLSGRAPGLAGVALTRPGVVNGVISDGHHVAPEVIRLCFAAAPGRTALVTDATAAAGMPDGQYVLGDVTVHSRDGAVHNQDGTLAGSAATLAACVRHAVEVGIAPAAALDAATAVPARLLRRPDIGVLRPGARADVVIVDDDLHVRDTLLEGRRHDDTTRH